MLLYIFWNDFSGRKFCFIINILLIQVLVTANEKGGCFSHLVKKNIFSNFPQLFTLILHVLKMGSTLYVRHRFGETIQVLGSLSASA